jgi:hypothetical protein
LDEQKVTKGKSIPALFLVLGACPDLHSGEKQKRTKEWDKQSFGRLSRPSFGKQKVTKEK